MDRSPEENPLAKEQITANTKTAGGNVLRFPFSRRIFLAMTTFGSSVSSLFPQEPVTEKTVKIHFLHHSTGENLINGAGGIQKMFEEYNRTHGTDYRFSREWSKPVSENYPYEYYTDTFNPVHLREYAEKYDIIIWKHCYPGSAVLENTGKPDISSSRKSVENYTLQYRALRARFDSYPDTKFMVWTLPPLHRKASAPDTARRATEFTEWVRSDYLTEDGSHPNLTCFDFRKYTAGDDMFLRYEYERDHSQSDSHPNQLANDTVCPVFFQFILGFVQKSVSVMESTPGDFRVEPAYPNPCNPSTVIRYRIPKDCHVALTILDRLGRRIAILRNGWAPAGRHEAVWNGRNIHGRPAASGVYFYSFTAEGYHARGKVTLIR